MEHGHGIVDEARINEGAIGCDSNDGIALIGLGRPVISVEDVLLCASEAGPPLPTAEVLAVLANRPEWMEINRRVQQKRVE